MCSFYLHENSSSNSRSLLKVKMLEIDKGVKILKSDGNDLKIKYFSHFQKKLKSLTHMEAI